MNKQQLFIRVAPEHESRVKVYVPWQCKNWIDKIKSLPNRAWNKKKQYWSVPKNEATLLKLKTLFGTALQVSPSIRFEKKEQQPANFYKKTPKEESLKAMPKFNLLTDLQFKKMQQGNRIFNFFVGQKIVIRKGNESWLQVWIPYDKKDWIEVVKNIPGRKWEIEGKFWLVPYVKDSLKRLWHIIGKQHIQYDFKINTNIPNDFILPKKQVKKSPKFELNGMQKRAIIAFEEKLLLEHKAWRTIKTYKGNTLMIQGKKDKLK